MSDQGDGKKSIIFHYLKSGAFRVVHVDGVIGGLTPTGNLHFAAYGERGAIPRTETYALKHTEAENYVLGHMEDRETRGGIVREMEVDLVMNLEVASQLRDWLVRALAPLESSSEESS